MALRHALATLVLGTAPALAFPAETAWVRLARGSVVDPELPNVLARDAAEPVALTFAAARGEWETVSLVVGTDRRLTDLRLDVGTLVGPKGSSIPATALRLQRVEAGLARAANGALAPVSEWLLPAERSVPEVEAGRAETFWITVH